MPRYIDADALIRLVQIDALCNFGNFSKRDVIGCIKALPTADVVPSAEVEQLKRNLEQCENGYRQEMHLLQCKLKDATSGAEKQKLEVWRLQGEVEQLQHRYDLAVAEREANVKGFTEELSKAKSEVERLEKENEKLTINMNAYGLAAKRLAEEKTEIFAEIEKIIEKHHGECYEFEDGDECDTAITYISYISVDIDDLKKKHTEGVQEEK